ncbi:MAG: hypothetical protein E7411_00320 [Ruminococcaceae bacterium]|nr:hypothetical protein [Oscillospiraceae bacterium]
MKNIFKIIIACTLLLSLMSMGVCAANTIEISDDTISKKDGVVTVNFTASGFMEGDAITILVFKVTDTVKEPDNSNIVYMGQPEYKDEMSAVTFKLPEEETEGIYEVRVGGTGVEAYSLGQFSAKELIIGDLDNNGVIDKGDVVIILKLFFGEKVDVSATDCDLTNDGIVNVKDAVKLLKMIE